MLVWLRGSIGYFGSGGSGYGEMGWGEVDGICVGVISLGYVLGEFE